jgi:outer membrane protein
MPPRFCKVFSKTGPARHVRAGSTFQTLRAAAIVALSATTMLPQLLAAQVAPAQNTGAAGQKGTTPPVSRSVAGTVAGLPPEPMPNATQPLFMRPGNRDFLRPRSYFPNPLAPYLPTTAEPARFTNAPHLNDLIHDGKIYLSLSDAIVLALENNYDIAIQRYNLDIADTDILRAKSGASLLGVNSGLVTGTQGGATASLASGGGPGGTSVSSSGAASGASGLALTTNGGGPAPEQLDPVVGGTIELQREYQPESSPLFYGSTRLNQNLNQYNFTYTQGFATGTQAQFTWDNSYTSSSNPYNPYKQRALNQSTQLQSDDEKQLKIGTLAPLDVVNAQSAVSTDQQALVSAKSNLEYQQIIMKQAISRNLEDPILTSAPVIPTDRVDLAETPEEAESVNDLVRQADANSPELEQAKLALKNDEITLKAEKNGLLPTLDAFAFYGGSGLGGSLSPTNCATTSPFGGGSQCAGLPPSVGYGSVIQNTFNNSSPNKGAGLTLSIPIRNREAQSEQARSVLEYRQEQLRLQQLYVTIRMQVINQLYALTNDRAQVKASQAAEVYASQSFTAEQRKLKLGASTTANVLQQERNLATADDNLINARGTYAKDRAEMDNILADTLDKYGISLGDAVSGNVSQTPVIPGLIPASQEKQVMPPLPTPGTPGGSPNEGLGPDGQPVPMPAPDAGSQQPQ